MRIGKLFIGREASGPEKECSNLAAWYQPSGHWRWILFHDPRSAGAVPKLLVCSGRISMYIPKIGEFTIFVFPDFTRPQYSKYMGKRYEGR